jgi:Outer membrane protein beta-barrel domain
LSAVALALAEMLAIASPAAAQTPRVDVSAGYQFTKVFGDGDNLTIPIGWYADLADLAGHLSPMFSLVFEVTGAYKTQTESVAISSTQTLTAEAKARLHTFMGGVRASGHTTNTAIVPFAQALFGAANLSASLSASGTGLSSLSESQSETKTAMLLGGGVNLMTTRRAGIRAAAAYRRIFVSADEGGGENDFLFHVGVVVQIAR